MTPWHKRHKHCTKCNIVCTNYNILCTNCYYETATLQHCRHIAQAFQNKSLSNSYLLLTINTKSYKPVSNLVFMVGKHQRAKFQYNPVRRGLKLTLLICSLDRSKMLLFCMCVHSSCLIDIQKKDMWTILLVKRSQVDLCEGDQSNRVKLDEVGRE